MVLTPSSSIFFLLWQVISRCFLTFSIAFPKNALFISLKNYFSKLYFAFLLRSKLINDLTPSRKGWGAKRTSQLTSFSSETSANAGVSPQNVLTFNFNPFPVPNYWSWTKTTPQKSGFSGQILVKLNFSHWNARLTNLLLHYQIYNIIWLT